MSLLGGRSSGLYLLVPEPDPESDDVCDDTPIEGVLDFVLGFEVRSASWMTGGCGERAGRAWCDIEVGESGREAGNEDSEVLRDGQGPLAFTGAAFGGEVRWAAEEGGAAWTILDWAPGRGGGGGEPLRARKGGPGSG